MDLTRAWITYVVVRVVAFVVPFAAVMLALPGWQWNWLLGAVFGALASQALSVIALRPQRERIAQGLAERRAAEDRPRDTRRAVDLEEDADLDAHEPVEGEPTSAPGGATVDDAATAEPSAGDASGDPDESQHPAR